MRRLWGAEDICAAFTRRLRGAGDFNVSNLTNDNSFPLGYCDGTKIVEKRFNITTGTFTAIR